MFEICYHFNNKEKAYEFANNIHKGNTYAVVDTLANADFKNYIYSEKDRDNFVDGYVVICTYETIQTEHGVVRELQYTNVEKGKKMESVTKTASISFDKAEKDDTIKEDDKDLDKFEDPLEEAEEVKEDEETNTKINLKKILPYAAVAIIFYLLGKKRQRFVPIDNVKFKIPGYEDFSDDMRFAASECFSSLNKAYYKNSIVVCRDRKKKICATITEF